MWFIIIYYCICYVICVVVLNIVFDIEYCYCNTEFVVAILAFLKKQVFPFMFSHY